LKDIFCGADIRAQNSGNTREMKGRIPNITETRQMGTIRQTGVILLFIPVTIPALRLCFFEYFQFH
jgi:hypothetical protein